MQIWCPRRIWTGKYWCKTMSLFNKGWTFCRKWDLWEDWDHWYLFQPHGLSDHSLQHEARHSRITYQCVEWDHKLGTIARSFSLWCLCWALQDHWILLNCLISGTTAIDFSRSSSLHLSIYKHIVQKIFAVTNKSVNLSSFTFVSSTFKLIDIQNHASI